jgi:hypothetical protein
MKCVYSDGMTVDYSGSLHISKGADVDLVLTEEEIPESFKGELRGATFENSCIALRNVALEISDAVDSYIP